MALSPESMEESPVDVGLEAERYFAETKRKEEDKDDIGFIDKHGVVGRGSRQKAIEETKESQKD